MESVFELFKQIMGQKDYDGSKLRWPMPLWRENVRQHEKCSSECA